MTFVVIFCFSGDLAVSEAFLGEKEETLGLPLGDTTGFAVLGLIIFAGILFT